MKKRIITIMLIVIIALPAIIIAGCSNDSKEVGTAADDGLNNTDNPQIQESHESGFDISDWFELPSISIEPDIKEGVTKAKTETSGYEFYGRTEGENIKLAQINEIAVSVLKNEYGYSSPKGRIIHFIGEKGIWVSELSLEVQQTVASNGRTVINPDTAWSVGALFYGSSRNLLPAWLSTGLELYWSDRFGIERLEFDKDYDMNEWYKKTKDFAAFGDIWFKRNDDTSKLSVAFSFVKWLDENGLLNEIVRTYLDDKQDEGDSIFASAWQTFTGQDIRGDFCFEKRVRHLYGYYLQTDANWDCYRYSFLTEQGHYLLDWLPIYSTMKEFFNEMDRQYIYVKQWIGFEDAAPIPTRIPFDRVASATAGAEYVSLPGGNSLASGHEAFHYFLFSNNIYADFDWLNEGFPEAMGFIYGNENPDFSYAQRYYSLLTGKEDYDSAFDFKHHAHLMALDAVNDFIENDIYGIHTQRNGQYGIRTNDKPSAFPQGFLNTYKTAASFVLFMLEMGSKEDFMKLYIDTSAAEELYGKDFNALYEQWLEFLNQI